MTQTGGEDPGVSRMADNWDRGHGCYARRREHPMTMKYVRQLVTDHWIGVQNKETELCDPSWSDIEAAIRNLDGKGRTTATLLSDGDAHLTVGGGENGQFVVYATCDGLYFFSLAVDDRSSDNVFLFVGGQTGDYPKNTVVDIALALRAARAFTDSGNLDPSLRWL
jgi:hypothetical protein